MDDFLTERFTAERPRLKAVAYRMLGSLSEADDAVQEAWLKLHRTEAVGVENLSGWLTTVVGRVCLDMLRSRTARREDSLEVRVPDPVVQTEGVSDPEHEALMADSVGLALLVVLETLGPTERLVFVLHDMFGVPFGEISPVVGRSPAATRQLASRARRRVRGTGTTAVPDDLPRQRTVVEAFLAASRGGDFEALVALLDPDVVLRADVGGAPMMVSKEVRGARKVAGQAMQFSQYAQYAQPVLVNGGAGVLTAPGGQPLSIMGFTITGGRIVAIHILADPERLDGLELTLPGFPRQ
ncbi:sigma-70 family RNA polymerase sigma factor [Streptomyces sp. NBC_00690]|uniref:sigma-70 family RNA polymerase sigma factor n=1 Tax=Streptomyces sp. NBC_00690 TaxID=2975808 RepID=UPI002E2C4D25|nr:sigma-70 family RNA polymerase sigma factor [Streptomyces sp. NBC_00690]